MKGRGARYLPPPCGEGRPSERCASAASGGRGGGPRARRSIAKARPRGTPTRPGFAALRRATLPTRGREKKAALSPHRSSPPNGCRMSFEKTPGWLDWYPNPSKPRFKVPPGAVDAHCHVFGPGDEFPFAPERKYTPCDASNEQLYALRDHLGFARNVVVQATCHGADNRAMVDALIHSGGKARGVATVKRSVTDDELQAMHASRRARRALQFRQTAGRLHPEGRADRDRHAHQTARLACGDLFRGGRSAGIVGLLHQRCRPTWWSITWAGRTSSKPVDGPEFALFEKFMREHGNVWSKVSCPERLSRGRPAGARTANSNAYRDVVPFARRIVEQFPGSRAVGHRLAASQSEGPHAGRRPAGRFHPAHRRHAGTAAQAVGRQPDATILAGGERRREVVIRGARCASLPLVGRVGRAKRRPGWGSPGTASVLGDPHPTRLRPAGYAGPPSPQGGGRQKRRQELKIAI